MFQGENTKIEPINNLFVVSERVIALNANERGSRKAYPSPPKTVRVRKHETTAAC